jgi:hypothetical protein
MLRFQLPLISHRSGFLDSWIDSFHDSLDLSEGQRPLHPNDQIDIRYSANGTSLLNIQSAQSGIGDVAMQVAYQAVDNNDQQLSYWLSLKLPTGDSNKLTGSDSTDLALWIAGNQRMTTNSWLLANLGTVFMSDSDVLKQAQNNHVFFGMLGMQYQAWEKVLLKFQFEGHGAFYDTSTNFLSEALLLTFGGTILFDNNTSLDIAVAEDVQAEESPDVNFNITWKSYF